MLLVEILLYNIFQDSSYELLYALLEVLDYGKPQLFLSSQHDFKSDFVVPKLLVVLISSLFLVVNLYQQLKHRDQNTFSRLENEVWICWHIKTVPHFLKTFAVRKIVIVTTNKLCFHETMLQFWSPLWIQFTHKAHHPDCAEEKFEILVAKWESYLGSNIIWVTVVVALNNLIYLHHSGIEFFECLRESVYNSFYLDSQNESEI